MNYIYLLLAFVVGLAITVQAGVNANLRQSMGNPILAAIISFGSGFVALVLMFLATGGSTPSFETIKQISWWKWTGGVMGAILYDYGYR